MVFYQIVAVLALATVFIANYTDLKERIIPNKLTFPMIIAGIALYLGYGIYQQNFLLAVTGGIGAGVTFGIGYLMWIIGGWAGGDVKLYAALGALLGGYNAPYMSAPYPFILTILLNGIICLAPVLIGYVIVKSLRTPGIGRKVTEPIREAFPEILITPFVLTGGSILGSKVTNYFDLGQIAQILIVLVIILVVYRIPFQIRIPIALGLTGYGAYLHSLDILQFLAISFVVVFGFRFIINSVKVINKHVLQSEIPINELKEGMIPAETIYEKNDEIRRYKSPGLVSSVKRIFENPKNFQLKPQFDKTLADSNLAAGVSDEQVELLKKGVKEEKIENHIRIKEGLPFAPSFAIGVPIAIFYGDIYWWIINLVGGIA